MAMDRGCDHWDAIGRMMTQQLHLLRTIGHSIGRTNPVGGSGHDHPITPSLPSDLLLGQSCNWAIGAVHSEMDGRWFVNWSQSFRWVVDWHTSKQKRQTNSSLTITR